MADRHSRRRKSYAITLVTGQPRPPWQDATCANAGARARLGSRLSGNYGPAAGTGRPRRLPGHPLARHIDDFLTDLANANKPRNTIRAHRGDLIRFAAHYDGQIAGLSATPIRAFLDKLPLARDNAMRLSVITLRPAGIGRCLCSVKKTAPKNGGAQICLF